MIVFVTVTSDHLILYWFNLFRFAFFAFWVFGKKELALRYVAWLGISWVEISSSSWLNYIQTVQSSNHSATLRPKIQWKPKFKFGSNMLFTNLKIEAQSAHYSCRRFSSVLDAHYDIYSTASFIFKKKLKLVFKYDCICSKYQINFREIFIFTV